MSQLINLYISVIQFSYVYTLLEYPIRQGKLGLIIVYIPQPLVNSFPMFFIYRRISILNLVINLPVASTVLKLQWLQ